ncbi:MAG TPA: GNVR domain-containing protein, partial [Burkholderiales bacterium]|nr:GNVR domain-containing protein [Burkholderiales bacterium]
LARKENRNEFTVLKRNVDSAEKAYDTAMQRHVVSQVESRANQTNITVLNAAVVPVKPSQPKIKLNILLSAVVGTMLGIAIVLLLEMSDRRIRSGGDLHLDVPLLAVLNTWRPGGSRLLGARSVPGALPSPG